MKFLVFTLFIIPFTLTLQAQKVDSLHEWIQKAEQSPASSKNKVELWLCIIEGGLQENPLIAHRYTEKLHKWSQKQSNPYYLGKALYFEAYYRLLLNEYSPALENLLKAEEKLKKATNPTALAKLHRLYSEIFIELENYPRALKHYEQSARLFSKSGNKVEAALNISNYALILQKMGRIEEALHYSDSCLFQMKALNQQQHIGTCYRKSGALLAQLGKHQRAEQYLNNSLREFVNRSESLKAAQALSLLAENSYIAGHYDKSNNYLKRSKTANVPYNDQEVRMRNLQTAYKLDSAAGDVLAALQHLQQYNSELNRAFKKSLQSQNERFNLQTQLRDQQHQLALMQSKSAVKDQKIRAQQFRIYLLISVIAGSLFTLFLTWRGLRTIKSKRDEIKRQSELIEYQRKELEKANEKLEKKVRARTAQLQKQYDQLKRFAFINAHEVRGPLSRILGITQVMEQNNYKLSKEEHQMFLQSLRASAKEMDSVLHNINRTLQHKKN